MKDKPFKVIRFIFYTIAIISMVFGLAKKVGLCASSVPTSYPLPIGDGYGYGGNLSSEFLNTIIPQLINPSNPPDLITCTSFNDNGVFYFNVYFGLNSINLTGSSNLNSRGEISYSANRVIGKIIRNGVIDGTNYSSFSPNTCIPSNYVLPVSGNEFYVYLQRNVFIPSYPLYLNDNISESIYSDYFYFLDESSGGDDSSGGSITINGHSVGGGTISSGDGSSGGADGSFDLEFDFDLDIPDYSGQLDNIGGSLDSISGAVDDLGGAIDDLSGKQDTSNTLLGQIKSSLDRLHLYLEDGVGTVQDYLEDIYEKLSDLYDYITEPFNETKFNNKLSSLQISQDINSLRGSVNSITSTFNVSASSSSDMRFEIPFTLPYINYSDVAVIDFAWYENIRNTIAPFIVAFLSFGFILSLIRSIPGIFHGNAPDNEQ